MRSVYVLVQLCYGTPSINKGPVLWPPVSLMHERRDKKTVVVEFVPTVLAPPCLKKPDDAATMTMHDALSRGPAVVADVGCGSGGAIMALAEAYPNARFIGIDIQAEAVAAATAKAARYGCGGLHVGCTGSQRLNSIVAVVV